MGESRTLEILKQAILLERRGKSFYQKVSEQSDNGAIKTFFQEMADEEKAHMEVLVQQLKAYKEKGHFSSATFDPMGKARVMGQVLTNEIKEKISAAGFEAAAIGAAISMEERAVKVYSERAESATDPEEKKLYQWLSTWEKQHLEQLLEIDKALTEKIWFDNKFWPF